jgi:hypothetical protein
MPEVSAERWLQTKVGAGLLAKAVWLSTEVLTDKPFREQARSH